MGAGEYVSVSSQRELLAASPPVQAATALTPVDFDENEVALVFRARGMTESEAEQAAAALLRQREAPALPALDVDVETVGTPLGVALSSFAFFASGALVPIVPYLFGLSGLLAVVIAAGLVGIALLASGAVVGLLSGAPMLLRALRQLLIGYGAAAVTYVLGSRSTPRASDPCGSQAAVAHSGGMTSTTTARRAAPTASATSASRIGYGAMQLAGPGVFGPPKDHDAAIAVLRAAVERASATSTRPTSTAPRSRTS